MRGRIRDSVAFAVKNADGSKRLLRRSLAAGLALPPDPGAVVVFRDAVDGLEYIREVGDLRERGLRVELEAYATRVLLDWRDVPAEAAGEYRALAADLGGAGVPSVAGALAERRLRPVHDAAAILVNEGLVRDVTEAVAAHLAVAAAGVVPRAPGEIAAPAGPGEAAAETLGAGAEPGRPPAAAEPAAGPVAPDLAALVAAWRGRAVDTLHAVRSAAGSAVPDDDLEALADRFAARLRAAIDAALAYPVPEETEEAARAFVAAALAPDTATWGALLGVLAADAIGGVLEPDPAARRSCAWFDGARLGRVFADAYRWRGLDEGSAWWTVETVRHLLARPGQAALAAPPAERPGRLVRAWFADEDLARWLGVNRYEGIAYLNREAFEAALRWLVVLVAVGGPEAVGEPAASPADLLGVAHALAVRLAADAAAAGYEVGRLVERATA
jgi:hypothetical protein